MDEQGSFVCSTCGERHEGWPALGFESPVDYYFLSEEHKNSIATLSQDFCVINFPDQTNRFIRCTLTQKVIDSCQDLDYGLWVSLSEKSFNDYAENFDSKEHEVAYFGWLCSMIPGYESTTSIPTSVYTRAGNHRPEIIPHKDFDHPFVRDYYSGITREEAERRIEAMMNGGRK